MPTYEYICSKCEHTFDLWHGMTERPLVHCDKCRGACIKLISGTAEISGMSQGRGLYDFVDHNTTGRPVVIKSKRQWQNHLKSHGLNDDVPNSPLKRDQLKEGMKVDKAKMKRDTKEAIVAAVKDKKWKHEFKQSVKKQQYLARNS